MIATRATDIHIAVARQEETTLLLQLPRACRQTRYSSSACFMNALLLLSLAVALLLTPATAKFSPLLATKFSSTSFREQGVYHLKYVTSKTITTTWCSLNSMCRIYGRNMSILRLLNR